MGSIIKKLSVMPRTNRNYSKSILKSFPNTNFRDYTNDRFDIKSFSEFINTMEIKKVVITYMDNIYATEMKERWEYLEQSVGVGNNDHHEYQLKLINSGIYDTLGIDYVLIDSGKMLAGDEEEYQKILAFIDEPPIPNFKELADEHYNLVMQYKNYKTV